ncbi:glycosyltransferase [Luteolibacter arcticus]|uniref:Glycosyltransferase n=1 Tax=Luteolibacter arcticus TaxID=1581411 RepID=A0ABT3GJ53_9BACT|nr:glycosyltransferase [Luteolibacter arcticus]MCW1923542.1 glycosyltransferase [Luteolibacter arcticus]
MKVLVSAYACDPYQGSEPGVGWTAVCRIARQHDVWVLSHTRHQEGWERARSEGKVPPNVTVRFLGENRPWLQNRFLAHLQSWKSFADYMAIVLEAAQAWHREIGFDLCHQVTIATWRIPSPLWKLPIPLVWGPIGGGGYIPAAFRSMLSPAARGFEFARDLNSARALRSQGFQDCVRNSAVVFAANEETELLLKPHRGDKPLVKLPIASIPADKAEKFRRPEGMTPEGPLRLFAGGNMEGRKGVSLALKALAKVAAAGIDFRYTVAGGGPEVPVLMKLAERLGLTDRVEFHPGFSGQDYIAALQATDVYFLPSFRESTPVTLLEAYLAGCYPVVADTSAQGEIVRMAGGSAIPITDIAGLVDGLAQAVMGCARHRDELPAKVAESRSKLIAYFDSARYDQAIADAYRVAMETRSGPC